MTLVVSGIILLVLVCTFYMVELVGYSVAGTSEPNDANEYMNDFVEEMNGIDVNGVTILNKTMELQ